MPEQRTARDGAYDAYERDRATLEHEASILSEYSPPLYPPSRGKVIRLPTYVPPHDRPAQVATGLSETVKRSKELLERERRSLLVRFALPRDLSLASCRQMRSAIVLMRSTASVPRSALHGQALADLSVELRAELSRRCERPM